MPKNLIDMIMDGLRILGPKVSGQAALYSLQRRFHEGRFSEVSGAEQNRGSLVKGVSALVAQGPQAPEGPPVYRFPGRVLAHQWHDQVIEITCENAMVQIAVLAPDLFCVRTSPTGRFPPPFSYAIDKTEEQWDEVKIRLEETRQYLWIRTDRLHCRIEKAHLAIAFLDPDGTVISADAAGAGWQEGTEKVLCWKQLAPDERIYGLGQKATRLQKRGLSFEMWNTDPQTYDPGDDPLYSNIPFYLGLINGRGYGLFLDNPARGRFDFGRQTPGITRFEAECAELRYYFFYGPALTTVLDRYTELTGRMAMPPLWALGYHQNRWSYTPDARVREIANEFRTRQIPCEAIHLDIDYMDGFRPFTWDEESFPDPAGLIQDLHEQGFKVVTMLDPGIKVDPAYWVYQDGLQHDVFSKYPDGKFFRGPVWPGTCVFPDFTSPRVRTWWGTLYESMLDLGVDGFWNDMNDPTVLSIGGDTLPDAVQHEFDGQGADHREAHNVYGMQMARASIEGLQRLRPDERPLVISRSVWAGSQRYNMHWLGDNRSDWESLANTMQLVLSLGLTGIAFTGPDTGGFEGTPSGELLIRWNQMSAFMPFFRNHTRKKTGDQEPWALGEACERISRHYIELRYHLLPYHYTAFWQSAQSGVPMVRPLILDYQDDPHVLDVDDQYMYGDDFLVAPVVEPKATSRRVYIPQGSWYDFWTNERTAGPQITRLEAPIHQIPLLVRAGSIIPAWPAMQHTGERPVDPLVLHVYPGEGDSWLYEDDGQSWDFLKGVSLKTHFVCHTERGTGPGTVSRCFVMRECQGAFTPTYTRVQVAVHGIRAAPTSIKRDETEILDADWDEAARTVTFEAPLFTTIELDWS